jgi:hypothetical protein
MSTPVIEELERRLAASQTWVSERVIWRPTRAAFPRGLDTK